MAPSWRAISRDTFPSTALATAQRLAVTSTVVLFGCAARLRSLAVSSLGTRHYEPVRLLRMSNPFGVGVGACWSMESQAQFDLEPEEPLRIKYRPRPWSMSKNSATVQAALGARQSRQRGEIELPALAKYARLRRSALNEAWFTTSNFASGNSTFIVPMNSAHTTFSANHATFRYFARNRYTTMKNVATCSRASALDPVVGLPCCHPGKEAPH